MATLEALFNARNDTALQNRVSGACLNFSKDILLEVDTTPHHAERMIWAIEVLDDNGEGPPIKRVFRSVTVVVQDNADPNDAEIQAAVEAIVDKLTSLGV